MSATAIEWTDRVWNPVRGCSRVSEGCRNCYAERQAARFSEPGQYAHGFVERTPSGPRWTGRVELVEDKLREPLGWRRPSRVFVNSMADLFHEALSDEAIDRVFAAMALAPRHAFQVLTKRPERMRTYLDPARGDRRNVLSRVLKAAQQTTKPRDYRAPGSLFPGYFPRGASPARYWPPPNVWLGVSVEDQATADARIPLLLQTPAAVRFVSYEPALGPVDFDFEGHGYESGGPQGWVETARPDWIIVGGESGPEARPCDVDWIRSTVEQCRAAQVPCFVKQLGARPMASARPLQVEQSADSIARHGEYDPEPWELTFRDRKGGDPSEWPEGLRVREFPR